MRLTSAIAIYALFWSLSLFLVLPCRPGGGVEPGAHVPGQADSAPPGFSVGRAALWTTLVSMVLFGLFYANYVEGWLSADRLNLVPDAWLRD
jgi:predicted secreted protein